MGLVNTELPDEWTIDGDTVYKDDYKVGIYVNPYRARDSGWVSLNFTSKVFTGEVDLVFGFDREQGIYPREIEYYSPHYITMEHDMNLKGWVESPGVTYDVNATHVTIYSEDEVWTHEYDRIDAKNKIIYWNQEYYREWKAIPNSKFDKIRANWKGMTTWYTATFNIIEDKEYNIRYWLDIVPEIGGLVGHKYCVGFKPHDKSVKEAIASSTFYLLDPWWDNTWIFKNELNITGSTAGALTDYVMKLRVHRSSGTDNSTDVFIGDNCQADYDDIRFVNSTETGTLYHWKQDNHTWFDYATFYFKVPSIPASPSNATVYMYYYNPAAEDTSDGDNVFPFFDDFLTDPNLNPDWTTAEGKPYYLYHFDWHVGVRGASISGGWSWMKGTKDLVLSGGNATYGWSMEWSNAVATNEIGDTFPYYGGGLADDLAHFPILFDELYSGVSWYWRLWNPFSGRLHYYDEWNAAGDEVQSNHAAYPWGYGPIVHPPEGPWVHYEMTLFNDSSQVYQNGTLLREFVSLDSNYLTLGLDPSFSAHGKALDGNSLEGFVNWVLLRPLADPEPVINVGSLESEYPINCGVRVPNIDTCETHDWMFEGRKQYEFIAEYSFDGGGENITAAGIGFYDGAGRFHYIILETTVGIGRATVTSPLDGISAVYTEFESSGDDLTVTFLISLNPTITDILDTPIYMISYYYNETSGWGIAPLGEDGWEDTSWLYRTKMTFDSSKIDENLANFPVLVHLDSTFNWTNTQNDGDDIRFVSSTGAALKAELELWDDENDAWMWVKVPTVSSTTDTYFYMYYGNPTAASAWDPEPVWDDNFVAVYHMTDNTTSSILDSTQYDNDGTKVGANEPIETVDGKINSAQDFDGTNDKITIDDSVPLSVTADLTISAWIYIPNIVGNKVFVSKSGDYYMWVSGDNIVLTIANSTVDYTSAKYEDIIVANTWYYVVGVYNTSDAATGQKVYVDMVVGPVTSTADDIRDTVNSLLLSTTTGADSPYNGTLDEVRISNVTRSLAWNKASYYSEIDDLLTFGDEEEFPGYITELCLYNLGGYAELDVFRGVGGRPDGGGVFDLYASLGAGVRANMTYRNLQHYHALFHWYVNDNWMAINSWWNWATIVHSSTNITFGVDYCVDGVWLEGWRVDIEKTEGAAGTFLAANSQAWIELTAYWYNRGVYVKNETFYAWYESYKGADTLSTQTGLWIDLWFNKVNASTTIGGRISAEHYGMQEMGWGPWTDWAPKNSSATSSMFFGDLLNSTGAVMSCTEITLMKVWSRIDSDDIIYKHWLRQFEVESVEVEPGSMRGIDTPPPTKTTTPDITSSGFWAAVIANLGASIERAFEGIWMTMLAGWTFFARMSGAFFAWAGVPDFRVMIDGFLGGGFSFVVDILENNWLFEMFEMFFTVVSGTLGGLLDWGTRILTTLTNIFTIVTSIWDGTLTGVGEIQDMWALMNWAEWQDAVPIFIIISWMASLDDRWRKAGRTGWMGFFIGDLRAVALVFSFIFGMFMTIINFVVNLIFRLIESIPVVE